MAIKAVYLPKDELYHHGILGMKWGVRRYQNKDGTYTKAGMERYRTASKNSSKILEAFDTKESLYTGHGADKGSILSAEKELNLTFAKEYKDYLKEYGLAAYDGHELTGITTSPRLDVVSVTKTERKKNPNITSDMYVIEQANIDDIVILQSSDGRIMYSAPGIPPKVLCKSLSEYVSKD